ncbi:HEAT repeat domain-containing protein [Streptomyces sp. NPDC054786]
MEQLETAWTTPAGADARQREVWADSLGDLLGSAYLTQADAERVVRWLVQWAVSDMDYAVRESALHAVSEAGVQYELPYTALAPLAANIDSFEPLLLEYVLCSLSATHDKRALRAVEPFLTHPDAGVREEAVLAMAELRETSGRSAAP